MDSQNDLPPVHESSGDPYYDDLLKEAAADPAARAIYEDTLSGLRLRAAAKASRKSRRLTQKQAAAAMGTTQSAISDLESGRVDAQLSTWQRYSRAIGKRFVFGFDDGVGSSSQTTATGQSIGFSSFALSPLLTRLHRSDTGEAPSQISEETGLPEPLVVRVLARLQEEGWARAEGEGAAQAFKLVEGVANLIGIELHRDRLVGGLVALNGERSHELVSVRIEKSTPEAVIEASTEIVRSLFGVSERDEKRVLGVGVTLAGIVDGASGRVDYAPALQSAENGWAGVELETLLERRIQAQVHPALRVAVENDASALAAWSHHGQDESMAVVLMSSGGIGAGILVDGTVVRGAHSAAGELGHLVVDHSLDAPICLAGHKHQGCLETVASVQGILRRLRIPASTAAERETGLAEANARIEDGDSNVYEAFFTAGQYIGKILPLCSVLDPERIVVYASPYLHEPGFETANAFQAGISGALTDASVRGLHVVPLPPPEWQNLEEGTLARAAAFAALKYFLKKPTRWYPGLQEKVDRHSELVLA